ncbi:uncharacterized protein K452DRAFT_31274 [Aplosporella prunicola CBS 121167]|uniref:Indole-diterpene biosynthesis protein PaxU n=1 Tax=Aplosporella prunicola CBS 121167 TaxID=1176127 RepID=A0A6A6BFE4_9PEZI|nr:uncharacterized protein K452DRAFT_31274 [Aplosporella prunicola CBS 121167]KAF2141637.1 hypothetical protein K452DRAFT_31274 [Aplosporella prunicola CBS 121167]
MPRTPPPSPGAQKEKAAPPHPHPLAAFTRLAPTAYLYTPAPCTSTTSTNPNPTTTTTTSHQPPALILLATWYAAAPAHIAKYAAQYRALYPRTPQLLLTSTLADATWRPRGAQERGLRDVVGVARGVVAEAEAERGCRGRGGKSGGIVVHAFSNGGALTACAFARAWRGGECAGEEREGAGKAKKAGGSRSRSNTALPLRALLLDSTPGRPSIRRGAAALAAAFGGLTRILLLAALYPAFALLYLLTRLPRVSDPITRVRQELLDDSLFARAAPRCYFFSGEDEMVGWEDVVAHAGEARGLRCGLGAGGVGVREVRFEGSGHVRHAVVGAERYWEAVRGVVGGVE